MTRRDFLYWLQGYFELAEAEPGVKIVALMPQHVECIRKHAALVYATEGVPFGEKLPNAGYDTLALDWISSPEGSELEGEQYTGVNLKALRQFVQLAFKHVIDPAAGGPDAQANLNAIHTPASSGDGDDLADDGTHYRC